MMIVTFTTLLATSAFAWSVSSSTFVSQVDATREIATCALKKDRGNAAVIASNEPTTPAFDKAARKIEPALAKCLKADFRSLNIRINDLRGAFAELLLKEDGGAPLLRAQQLPAIAARRIELGKYASANDAALIRCATNAAPQSAVTLVQAAPGSTEEGDAFRSLSPSLQSCVPEKAEMHLKPFQVRLLVAAALYGRLAAPAGG